REEAMKVLRDAIKMYNDNRDALVAGTEVAPPTEPVEELEVMPSVPATEPAEPAKVRRPRKSAVVPGAKAPRARKAKAAAEAPRARSSPARRPDPASAGPAGPMRDTSPAWRFHRRAGLG